MKMEPNCKKQNSGQLNSMDMLSDLPDFIISHIISFLDLKEAYRTSVLSKRWSRISATSPVLVYKGAMFGTANFDCFDTRMQRYRKEKLCIKELCLMLSGSNLELKWKVDDWVEIAVRNQVSKLSIVSGSFDYKLPAILFTAKTLTYLYCSKVGIPYYNAVDFASLEWLKLNNVALQESMLDHIISSCRLLKELCVSGCAGIKNIVIPRSSFLEKLDLTKTVPRDGAIVLKNSTLKVFSYIPKDDYGFEKPGPIIMNGGALRNLRTLFLSNVDIIDNVLSQLLSEFRLLESLVFWRCQKLSSMKISSTRIKDIRLKDCIDLTNIVIDAPSLKKFKFIGALEPPVSISITNNEPGCVISVHVPPLYLDTDGFIILKRLLKGLNGRNSFKISLEYESSEVECGVEFNEEELGNVSLGPPCDVGELKICFSGWRLVEYALSPFVNALFLICRPQMISFGMYTSFRNLTVEAFVSKLEEMAKCWRHPLKHVQVEGTDCSRYLKSGKLYLRVRLFW